MEFVSKSTITKREEKWDHIAKIFTLICEPMLVAFLLVVIILSFNPLTVNESPVANYTVRVGFWITYGGPSAFSFGGLNLFGIIGFVVAFILFILVYYFNLFKSENSLLNRYAFIGNGSLFICLLIALLVGELATIDGGRTFIMYNSIGAGGETNIFQMNGIGYILMGFVILLLVLGAVLWSICLGYIYQITHVKKLRKTAEQQLNQQKKP